MKIIENRGIYVMAAVLLFSVIAIVPVVGQDHEPSSPSAINCIVSSTTLSLGDELTVSGSVSPAVSEVTVTLTYTKPDSTTIDRTVVSEINGSFQDVYSPDLIGRWSVKARWLGNVDYLGSTSFAVDFEVRETAIDLPIELIAAVGIVIIIIVVLAVYWFTKRR